jgi:hypothetical protein
VGNRNCLKNKKVDADISPKPQLRLKNMKKTEAIRIIFLGHI